MRQKLAAVLMMLTLLLSSCGTGETVLREGLQFREQLLNSGGCGFSAKITAEAQDRGYVFVVQASCSEDVSSLSVIAPESIAGITAEVTALDATIGFDGVALDFGTMDDVMTSPLYLPWLLNACWREAYIDSAGMDGALYRVTYLWGTEEEELTLECWFSEGQPVRAEVYRQERLLLSAEIEGFTFGA